MGIIGPLAGCRERPRTTAADETIGDPGAGFGTIGREPMTSLLRRRTRSEPTDAPVISMVDVGMTYPNGKVALRSEVSGSGIDSSVVVGGAITVHV